MAGVNGESFVLPNTYGFGEGMNRHATESFLEIGSSDPLTGTLTKTLDAITSSAAATSTISADASITLGAITLSASSQTPILADASDTIGAVTLSATGTVPFIPPVEENNPTAITFNPPETPAATDSIMSIDFVDEDSDIAYIVITVKLALSGIHEVAYMNGVFGPRYQGAGNSVETITNGLRVNLQRIGGWPERAVQFLTTVVDQDVV